MGWTVEHLHRAAANTCPARVSQTRSRPQRTTPAGPLSVGCGTVLPVTIRLGSTVINCADLETMTDFWCAALALEPNHREPDDDFRVLRGPRVNLSLQRAKTPVSARDQMHLDLYGDDIDGEVERLRGLGAEWVRRVEEPDDVYVVLRDPESNEFCVCLVEQPTLEGA